MKGVDAMVVSRPDPEGEVAFGEEALRWLEQSSAEGPGYWSLFVKEQPGALALNFHAEAAVLRVNGRVWPLSVSAGRGESSYPCSLLTQYVRYPLAELSLVPSRLLRTVARAGLTLLGAVLRFGRVDRCVQWSSSLLSTDLHDPALGAEAEAEAATRALCGRFPDRAILVRNIHAFEDPGLPERLEAAGYELLTSRQIYFFDGKTGAFGARSDVKRDWKALRALENYEVVEHAQFTRSDVPRILELYRMLYLDKHSRLNPQYTERFVESALDGKLLEFRGLRHASGRLDGVFACFSRGGVTSTPFIGYDTTLPAGLGLYRLLVALLLQRVSSEKVLLNYSSGAGEFKRRRGAERAIEWNAVYVRHLPFYRRAVFKLLQLLVNRFGRRFLEENQI